MRDGAFEADVGGDAGCGGLRFEFRADAGCPFVAVAATPPALTEVVGTNRARLGVACAAGSLAVTVAIDNLVKGAAGGGVQWLNRIYGYDEAAGLAAAGLGWF